MDPSKYIGIFCCEAEEHLQALRQGLMALEKHGVDPERMRPLLRSVHTLKGSARLLNLGDFSRLAHALEDQLKGLESGEWPVTAALVDQLLAVIEALASLVTAVAVGGEEAGPPVGVPVECPAASSGEHQLQRGGERLLRAGGVRHLGRVRGASSVARGAQRRCRQRQPER